MHKGATTAVLTLALTVPASAASARGDVFSNPAVMTGLASGQFMAPHAKWNPYPAVIDVQGLSGSVANVTVRVTDWNQGDTSYVDMLLESPDGRRVMLLSDAGRSSGMTAAADHVNVVFDQTSPVSAPPSSGTGSGPLGAPGSTVFLRPTNHAAAYDDVFPICRRARRMLPAISGSWPADPPTASGSCT